MKITVEFDNLQDLNEFLNGVLVAPGIAGEARKEASEETSEKSSEEAPKQTKAKKSTPKAEKATEEAPAKAEEAPAKVEEPTAKVSAHTEGDLKLLLSEKLKAGKKAEVKKLFESYGVSCLTDLIAGQKDNLDEVYAKAEVI